MSEDTKRDVSDSNLQRILALEGGGTLALSYIPLLISMENALGIGIRDSNRFSMFVGTSTGAIIACALKLGIPCERILEIYTKESARIFKKSAFHDRFLFHKYSTRELTSVLVEQFAPFGDVAWSELADTKSFGQVELIVTLWNLRRGRMVYLSSDQSRRDGQHAIELLGAKIADIVCACCSAPYYFPPAGFFTKSGGYVGAFCDGGISGLNNPAVLGVAMSGRESSRHVISFGTGKRSTDLNPATLGRWTVVDKATTSINALMSSTSELMDRFHHVFGADIGVEKFLRTNQDIPSDSYLDETRPSTLELLQSKLDLGEIEYEYIDNGNPAEKQDVRSGRLDNNLYLEMLDSGFGLFSPSAPVGFIESEENSTSRQRKTIELVRKDLSGSFIYRFCIGNLPVATATFFTLAVMFAVFSIYFLRNSQSSKKLAEQISAAYSTDEVLDGIRDLHIAYNLSRGRNDEENYNRLIRSAAEHLSNENVSFRLPLDFIVNTAAMSDDERYLAAGGKNGEIAIWSHGKSLELASAEVDEVTAIRFDPLSRYLIVGSKTGELHVWDLEKRRNASFVLEPHAGAISSIEFDRSNGRMYVGSYDGRVSVWDSAANRTNQAVEYYEYGTEVKSIHCDGNKVVVSGHDGVRVWQANGDLLDHLLPEISVLDCALLNNPSGMAFATENGLYLQYARRDLEKVSDEVYFSLSTAPSGSHLVAAGIAGLRLWNFQEDIPIQKKVNGHSFWVNTAEFSYSGEHLLTASYDKTLRLWNTSDIISAQLVLNSCMQRMRSVAFDPMQDTLYGGTYEGEVLSLSLHQPEKGIQGYQAHSIGFPVTSIRPIWMDKVLTASEDGTLLSWLKPIGQSEETQVAETTPILTMSVCEKGYQAALVCGRGELYHFSGIGRSETIKNELSSRATGPITFAQEGRTLVFAEREAGSNVQSIVLLDLQKNRSLKIDGPELGAGSIISDGDSTLVVGGNDGVVRVWEIGTAGPTIRDEFRDHDFDITAMCISADKTRMASAGTGSGIVVRDLKTFEKLAEYERNQRLSVTGLSFVSDDYSLVSCSLEGFELFRTLEGTMRVLDDRATRIEEFGFSFTTRGK